VENQKQLLDLEGHAVEKRGTKYVAKDYLKSLTELI